MGRLKWRATGFDAYVSFFSNSKAFEKAVRQSSPCFAYVDLLVYCTGYAIDDIYGEHLKWIVILADRLGNEILAMLEIKPDKFCIVCVYI